MWILQLKSIEDSYIVTFNYEQNRFSFSSNVTHRTSFCLNISTMIIMVTSHCDAHHTPPICDIGLYISTVTFVIDLRNLITFTKQICITNETHDLVGF